MTWCHPCPGSVLGDRYGQRILSGHPDWHNGIDFKHCAGFPVVAPVDCVVIGGTTWDGKPAAETHTPNGNSVILEGGGVRIALLHLERKMPLALGQHLRSGEVVGVVGNTGFSFGPHLHMSVTDLTWHYLDPLSLSELAAVILTTPGAPTC